MDGGFGCNEIPFPLPKPLIPQKITTPFSLSHSLTVNDTHDIFRFKTKTDWHLVLDINKTNLEIYFPHTQQNNDEFWAWQYKIWQKYQLRVMSRIPLCCMSEDVTIAVFWGCIDQNETAHKLLATLNCITVQHITVSTYHFLCKSIAICNSTTF